MGALLLLLLAGPLSAQTELADGYHRAQDYLEARSTMHERRDRLLEVGLDEDDAWRLLMSVSGIASRFYRAVSEERLFEVAIDAVRGSGGAARVDDATRAMVEHLSDPYSSFAQPDAADLLAAERGGRYRISGVHTALKRPGEGWRVAVLHPQGAGARAGLREGDRVTAIGGRSLLQLDEERATRLWKDAAAAGSLVLGFERDGVPGEARVELSELRIPLAVSRALGETGYLYLYNFSPEALPAAEAELARLAEGGMRSLVLDLRHNPGGNAAVLQKLAGQFLPQGAAILRERRRDAEDVLPVLEAGRLQGMPLVIVIDGETASAAEAFSAAMQDHGRARIVGQTSTGKGTMQQTWGGLFGPAVTLTVAEWRTSLGRPIQGVGVSPDVPVPLDDEGHAAALERLNRLMFGLDPRFEDDPAINAALRELRDGL